METPKIIQRALNVSSLQIGEVSHNTEEEEWQANQLLKWLLEDLKCL